MIKAHINYLKYVLRHKWYVFWACREIGVSLFQSLLHDWTKFSPKEWSPYVRNFFNPDGSQRSVRDTSGAYDPNSHSLDFKYAWLSHQRNKHHWQAWVSIGDEGNLQPMRMPEKYVREMISDWIGAGKAQRKDNSPFDWWEKNKEKMILHPETRTSINLILTKYRQKFIC